LPKKWIDQNHIEKGSVIRIREEEGGLLSIIPTDMTIEQKPEDALIKISPKDNPDSVIRKVVSAYLVGYSLIHIKAEKQQQLSPKQRYDIKNFARQMLVGTEIVTDTPSDLTLQVLLSYPELSIQSALRRMSIITSSMHKDAITALKTLDHQLATSVVTTDNEVDRFTLYIIRQLKTAVQNPRIIKEIGLTNARDCLGYRLVTKSVERTADHAVSIAENVLPLKRRLSTEVIRKIEEMSEIAISMFETAIEALFKQDFNLAESIIEKTKDVAALEKEAVASSQKIDVDEVANLRLIIESVRRTAEYASDIAEVVLNLTVESIISGEHQLKQL
jgi:phosphate uptake regulator